MKIAYSWLRDYVDVDLPPLELADRLTMLGLEVDSVEVVDLSLEGVVVGRVVDVSQHPNADRLTVCRVDVGGSEPSQIVCGAPNVASGQLVPVALPGTILHLPDRDDPESRVPVEIRKSKIRGEESAGMICAEDELGLSNDHSGIMVLDGDAVPGTLFSHYLEDRGYTMSEAIYDIELTPNRPDATCHVGVAREIAAALGAELRRPEIPTAASSGLDPSGRVQIQIDNPDGCGRYVGILVEDVSIGESPDWMKHRLKAIGLRPRNVIVDITNYVMHELGQPLHAFDYNELAGGRIVVRNADQGEPFTTLDDQERKLDDRMLMICDAVRTVAIAGVMGGQNSEVTAGTRNVLIESAWFDPASIRRTARELGLQTDASYRFERGVDPDGGLDAAMRAADLMVQLAGGAVVEIVDQYPRPHEKRIVELRPERVQVILGVALSQETISGHLRSIGFGVESENGKFVCTVPSFRPDVDREIDLIEEVARLYGFDKVPPPKSTAIPYTPARRSRPETLRSEALTYLSGLGFREVYSNSLLPPAAAESVEGLLDEDGAYVQTFNPINRHMSALRPSLLPGILRAAAHNRNHGQSVIRLAEFGHVFHRGAAEGEKRSSWVTGYVEREALIMAIAGPSVGGSWDREESLADLFDLKGMTQSLISYLDVDGLEIVPSQRPHAALRTSLDILLDGGKIGVAGQVSPLLSRAFDLDADLFIVETFWSPIAEKSKLGLPKAYREISRFPTVSRDLAVVVEKSVRVGDLVDAIRVAAGPLLVDAGVFDIFEGESIGADKRSIGFSLEFGANRTLVDREVDEAVAGVVGVLATDWKAELRT